MQQQPQMMQSSVPATNITTEQIQKYLDENKRLIMAILDNQNLGKLAECAQYQALLQKNLMYLAAIADAQPPTPTPTPAVPPQAQMAPHPHPHPAMQQGGYFMQHPQAAAAAMAQAQQSGMFPQKVPLQYQMQDPQHQQHHHIFQGQMRMRPDTIHGGGNKQDAPGGGANGNSATGHDGMKGSDA